MTDMMASPNRFQPMEKTAAALSSAEMNEDLLRKRWADVLENSKEFEAASFAATRDQVARRARLAAIRQQHASNPVKLVAAIAEENARAGTGAGEIQLKALREHHDTKVRDYISRARGDQINLAASNGPGRAYGIEPDFRDHQPWLTFRGNVSPSKSELVENARRVARTEGRTFSNEEEVASLRARGAQLVPQGLADAYSAERRGKLDAFDAEEVQKAKSDFKSTADFARSRSRVAADQAKARGNGMPRINTNDFRFNSGGTIEADGDTFDVAPGIGPDRRMSPRPIAPGSPTGLRTVYPTADDAYMGTNATKLPIMPDQLEPEASPYGISPDEFVANRGASVKAAPVPAYPSLLKIGSRRPSAAVVQPSL